MTRKKDKMANMGNAGHVEEGSGAKIEEIVPVEKKALDQISQEDIEVIQQKHESVKNFHATIGAMFCQMIRIAAQSESSNEDLRNFVKQTILQQGIPEKEVENYMIRLTDGKIVKSDRNE